MAGPSADPSTDPNGGLLHAQIGGRDPWRGLHPPAMSNPPPRSSCRQGALIVEPSSPVEHLWLAARSFVEFIVDDKSGSSISPSRPICSPEFRSPTLFPLPIPICRQPISSSMRSNSDGIFMIPLLHPSICWEMRHHLELGRRCQLELLTAAATPASSCTNPSCSPSSQQRGLPELPLVSFLRRASLWQPVVHSGTLSLPPSLSGDSRFIISLLFCLSDPLSPLDPISIGT